MVEKVPMRPRTASIMFGGDTEHFAGKEASAAQIIDSLSRNLELPAGYDGPYQRTYRFRCRVCPGG